uniref:Putative ovule protein n=1 Tax=Solanum chacoense TaxID=4108 RepID=A0A0V0H073_SOLCH
MSYSAMGSRPQPSEDFLSPVKYADILSGINNTHSKLVIAKTSRVHQMQNGWPFPLPPQNILFLFYGL